MARETHSKAICKRLPSSLRSDMKVTHLQPNLRFISKGFPYCKAHPCAINFIYFLSSALKTFKTIQSLLKTQPVQMKPFLFLALVTLGGVTCGPVSIRDNNIGDITAIGMNVAADVQGDLNVNIANIILALLVNIGDHPRPPVGPPQPTTTTPEEEPPVTTQPSHPPPITPPITTVAPPHVPPPSPPVEELVRAIREIRQKTVAANLSQEQKDQLWREHGEPFVKRLMDNKN